MWQKPCQLEIFLNRQLKQTAKNSVKIEIDAYSLPFTLVNGLLQLASSRGFNPILPKCLIQ